MVYAFSESFVMPFSHDEVVHGKGSLIGKMPGDYWQKFAGVRVLMAYMMTHPGKKLTFMGCEIGQFDEWDHRKEVQWFLLDHEKHAALQRYIAELNHLYLENPALWQEDSSWRGFAWIDADRREDSVFTYRRMSDGEELCVALNFTPVPRSDFEIVLPEGGDYVEVFNSDRTEYGGSGLTNSGRFTAREDGEGIFRIFPNLPPLGAIIIRKVTDKESK